MGKKLESIEEPDQTKIWFPIWKDNCPNLALVVSDGSQTCVLEYVGPALDYEYNSSGQLHDIFDGIPAGIWISEVDPRTYNTWTDYGYEYDVEFETTERALTAEEWKSLKEDYQVFDLEKYITNWNDLQKL